MDPKRILRVQYVGRHLSKATATKRGRRNRRRACQTARNTERSPRRNAPTPPSLVRLSKIAERRSRLALSDLPTTNNCAGKPACFAMGLPSRSSGCPLASVLSFAIPSGKASVACHQRAPQPAFAPCTSPLVWQTRHSFPQRPVAAFVTRRPPSAVGLSPQQVFSLQPADIVAAIPDRLHPPLLSRRHVQSKQ